MREVITIEATIAGENIMVEMHNDPHAEEIAALVAIEDHGDKDFLNKYCRDGTLRLGTGGGPFDEHSNRETGERRKKGCCMTLVADALDLPNKAPWWRLMVLFCHYRDTCGQQREKGKKESVEYSHPFDLYSQVKLQFRWRRFLAKVSDSSEPFTEEKQVTVINHYKEVIRMFVWQQELLHEAAEVIKRTGRQEMITGPDGKKLKLIAVKIPQDQSENCNFNDAARGLLEADVFVQQDAGGNIHVFTNNKAELNLDDLAQAVNIREQEKAGDVVELNWATLREEGIPYEGGVWYYSKLGGNVQNSTERFPKPPTCLSLSLVVHLVKMTLDTSRFDARKAEDCRKGVCGRNGCCLYKYGLRRCRKIRYDAKLAREAAQAGK